LQHTLFIPDNLRLSKPLLRNFHTFFPPKKDEITLAAASTSAVTCGTPAAAGKGPPARQVNFDRWTMRVFLLLLLVINVELRGWGNTRRKFTVDIVCMEMPCQCHFSSHKQRKRT